MSAPLSLLIWPDYVSPETLARFQQESGTEVRPAEGSQVWEDDWAIAAGAAHPEAAHAFLDFVQRPDIAAQEAAYTRYATCSRSAFALLDEALRTDPATYAPADILQKLEPGMPLSEDGNRRREALWREVQNPGRIGI